MLPCYTEVYMKWLGFCGSLRAGSYNRMLLRAAGELLPSGVEFEVAEFGDLPLYNGDLETNAYPPAAAALKEKIRAADAILIVSPEYNRSIPGPLKNMLDWTGRPPADNPWPGKYVYVMGASSGNIGTALMQYDLKKLLLYYGCQVMGRPEFYLNYTDKFDAQGKLVDQKTKELLSKVLTDFAAFTL